MRIGLLLVLAWIVALVTPLSTVLGQAISGRDLILIVGGLFLVWKATHEIHGSLEGKEGEASSAVKATFTAVILSVALMMLFARPIGQFVPTTRASRCWRCRSSWSSAWC